MTVSPYPPYGSSRGNVWKGIARAGFEATVHLCMALPSTPPNILANAVDLHENRLEAETGMRQSWQRRNSKARVWQAIIHLGMPIVVAAIAAFGWQDHAFAQTKLPRVGVLTVGSPTRMPEAAWVETFRRTLAQQGWVEGKTVTRISRDAQGRPANFSRAAIDLINEHVDVILAISAPAIRVSYAATKSIPIVGSDYTNDPVAVGYAKSYAHPGGNVTGVFLDAPEFAAKWLEMMREIVPNLKRVTALWDPSPGDTHVRAMTQICKSFGIELQVIEVRTPEDIDNAGTTLAKQTQAIVVLPSPMHYSENTRLASLALKQHLPISSMFPRFADAGGLLGYGPDDTWTSERQGMLVAKVLRGTKAGDLPIERPVKFDLIVNLKTAKELGIKLPESVLTRAERIVR
jgi:putative tryptophan/tyrosine transport system substrate-binding protein